MYKINYITIHNLLSNIYCLTILWIILHYTSSHLYIYLCTPLTISGFIMSPFIAPAPHCQALRWLIYQGGNSISSMWIFLGSWFIKQLIPENNSEK